MEQLALAPMRRWAGAQPPSPVPAFDDLGLSYWLVLAAGAGLEVTIIALLAGPASRAAAAELVGHRLPARTLLDPRGGRPLAVPLIAIVTGGLVAVASIGGPVWFLAYPFVALAVPALVIDRGGPLRALGRGAAMAGRSGARALWILLLGYLTWWIVRMIVGLGGGFALAAFVPGDPTTVAVVTTGMRVAVNTLAYAALACLAAVLHLETRMRTEGLDIVLSRAGRRGPLSAELLAVTR